MSNSFDKIRKALSTYISSILEEAYGKIEQPPIESPAEPSKNLLRCACITNTGRCRQKNEDNYFFFWLNLPQDHQSLDKPLTAELLAGRRACVAIFDGMGGELAGEAASYAATDCLMQRLELLDYDEESLATAFTWMQQAVCDVRLAYRLSSIGTTASVMMTDGRTALVGNLGDSPIFLFREESLETVSLSHTDEVLLRELGINQKPKLTQYLGMDEGDAPIEPHIVQIGLELGDWVLLASDGLTDMVSLDTIADAIREANGPASLVTELCEKALEADGKDNITIIACQVSTQ